MANEFKHKSVGAELTQAEFEATDGHVLDSQATGDIVVATSATQLARLPVGTNGQQLVVASGAPAWASITKSAPTRVWGTVYQNTGTRPILVMATGGIIGGGSVYLTAYCDANSTPTTVVAQALNQIGGSGGDLIQIVFVVPASYYYRIIDGFTATTKYWQEVVL
jgi:hypothetical protein